MVSSRIPFRASKIKRELQQSFTTSLEAPYSDGAAVQKRKKRKPQPEEEADKMPTSPVEGLLVHNAVNATMTAIAETGEKSQISKMVAQTQVMVSVTSLSEGGAITAAIEHLKGCDAKLRDVIEASQLPSFQACISPFCSLARCIVYQQLATNAAAAIYKRLLLLCGIMASRLIATSDNVGG